MNISYELLFIKLININKLNTFFLLKYFNIIKINYKLKILTIQPIIIKIILKFGIVKFNIINIKILKK